MEKDNIKINSRFGYIFIGDPCNLADSVREKWAEGNYEDGIYNYEGYPFLIYNIYEDSIITTHEGKEIVIDSGCIVVCPYELLTLDRIETTVSEGISYNLRELDVEYNDDKIEFKHDKEILDYIDNIEVL